MWHFERSSAMYILKKLTAHLNATAEVRDLSIQIFDQHSNATRFESFDQMQTAAVGSLLLSSKMLEINALRVDMFEQAIPAGKLIAFERAIVLSSAITIMPTNTPSFIAHHLIKCWPNTLSESKLVSYVNHLIGVFCECDASLAFSPVIVAIVSTLFAIGMEVPLSSRSSFFIDFLSFCRLFLNGGEASDKSPFAALSTNYLKYSESDLDCCLKVFESLNTPQDRSRLPSPVTVASVGEDNYLHPHPPIAAVASAKRKLESAFDAV